METRTKGRIEQVTRVRRDRCANGDDAEEQMGGYETRVSCVGSGKQRVPVWVEDMCAIVEFSMISRADQSKRTF